MQSKENVGGNVVELYEHQAVALLYFFRAVIWKMGLIGYWVRQTTTSFVPMPEPRLCESLIAVWWRENI